MTEHTGTTHLSAADQLRHLRDTDRWGDPALTIGLALELLDERDRLAAAVERTTERLRYYAGAAVFGVNVRQVIALLSPTWPDGNYESSPQDGPQPEPPAETQGLASGLFDPDNRGGE
jgi:hypothetical protein